MESHGFVAVIHSLSHNQSKENEIHIGAFHVLNLSKNAMEWLFYTTADTLKSYFGQ